MKKTLAFALALLLATPAAATQYSLDFTDESGLMAFLAGTPNVAPWGISYVVSHDLANNGAQIHANGYKIKTYITGGIAENFQGYPNAKYVAYIQSVISSMVKPIGDATGADTLLVNELNVAPGEASLNTPASIAYNVAGLNHPLHQPLREIRALARRLLSGRAVLPAHAPSGPRHRRLPR